MGKVYGSKDHQLGGNAEEEEGNEPGIWGGGVGNITERNEKRSCRNLSKYDLQYSIRGQFMGLC